MNTVICKYCQKPRVKVDSGRRQKDRHIVWHDQDGRSWGHAKCPPCRYGTERRERHTGDRRLSNVVPRKCRKCDSILSKSRYFHCERCTAMHDSEGRGFYTSDDWGYGIAFGVRL